MNIIEIPVEHKLFKIAFEGSLDNFIYDEFGLFFTQKKEPLSCFVVKFNSALNGTKIYFTWHKDLGDIDVEYEIKMEGSEMNVYCDKFEDFFVQKGYEICCMVVRVMSYIMSTDRKRVQKESSSIKADTEHTNADSPKVHYADKNKTIYLLDDIIEYVRMNKPNKTLNESHYIISCPCWSVIGHYRRYKNGNIIFVKNYKKGKERERSSPKDKKYNI